MLRNSFIIAQVRHLYPNKKTKIEYQKFRLNSLFKNTNNSETGIALIRNSWVTLNQPDKIKFHNLTVKKLVIYPYSLSNNLIKEAVVKMGLKIAITKEIKKASLIIGLKKHLRKNFKLNKLAKQKNIPIYTINQSSIYQVVKLIQFILS